MPETGQPMASGEFKPMHLKKQSGFTYLAILFAIAIAGVVLAETGINWSQAGQREKERELLFVGNQFRQAIALYYERTPGAAKSYPAKLEELLADGRYNPPQHYLRKLYRDPVTNLQKWGLIIAPEGGIMGVHSLSECGSAQKRISIMPIRLSRSGKIHRLGIVYRLSHGSKVHLGNNCFLT